MDLLRTRRPLAAVLTAAFVVLAAVPVALGGVAVAQQAPSSSASAPAPSGTAPAPAPAPSAKDDPSRDTWAVSPGGAENGGPSTRPNFTYDLAPGATIRDAATIWNYSDLQRTFKVYAQDAFTTAAGGVDLRTADQAPTDVGSWVAFDTPSITVPPRSGVTVPLTITVPADATPGDHSGGIVASLLTGAPETEGRDQVVMIDHRVGLRLYLRVTGALNPGVAIEDLQTDYDRSGPLASGDVVVTYTVRNTGNVRLRAGQVITVTGPFGWEAGRLEAGDLPELLPGAALRRSERLTGIAPAVRLTTEVTLTPFAVAGGSDDEGGAAPVAASTTVWALPWLVVVILVLLAGGIEAVRRVRGRRRPPAPPVTGEEREVAGVGSA